MYCGGCGTKIEQDDKFCGNCGAVNNNQESKTNPVNDSKPRQPMSKQKKIIMGVVALVVIALAVVYNQLSTLTSPKEIAKDYISAVVEKDADKLFKHVNVDKNNPFVSKKVFNEIVKTSTDDDKSETDIESYTIKNTEYSSDKKTVKIKVSVKLKETSYENDLIVSLTKQDKKKWLFFDNWKLSESETKSLFVKDYKINAPTGSKVTYAGIDVDKKYLDKSKTTSTTDVYILKQVFSVATDIKVELPSGFKIEKSITPSQYSNSYTAKISLDNLDSKEQQKITDIVKNDLDVIYDGLINKKEFKDISSKLSCSGEDTKKIEANYKELLSDSETSSTTLTSIDFTVLKLTDLDITDDGYYKFDIRIDYKYSIKYTNTFSEEEQTKESSKYSYIDFTYSNKDNKYKLVEVDELVSYFSKY